MFNNRVSFIFLVELYCALPFAICFLSVRSFTQLASSLTVQGSTRILGGTNANETGLIVDSDVKVGETKVYGSLEVQDEAQMLGGMAISKANSTADRNYCKIQLN